MPIEPRSHRPGPLASILRPRDELELRCLISEKPFPDFGRRVSPEASQTMEPEIQVGKNEYSALALGCELFANKT
jgi:hypothetical protein